MVEDRNDAIAEEITEEETTEAAQAEAPNKKKKKRKTKAKKTKRKKAKKRKAKMSEDEEMLADAEEASISLGAMLSGQEVEEEAEEEAVEAETEATEEAKPKSKRKKPKKKTKAKKAKSKGKKRAKKAKIQKDAKLEEAAFDGVSEDSLNMEDRLEQMLDHWRNIHETSGAIIENLEKFQAQLQDAPVKKQA